MKYYITADIHGFYSEFHKALEEAGYFTDPEVHKLVILGDIFDRGQEAIEMQRFILELMERDAVILVRGNHEDLFGDLVTTHKGLPLYHHRVNGTFETAMQLTGYSWRRAITHPLSFAAAARETPFYQRIIPATIDWFETEHYIFVHGWIPCESGQDGSYRYDPDWRKASAETWRMARWTNGMDAAQSCRAEKTILCGHFHCSYGHSKYEHKGSEFGPDADFSPYRAPGVIALDACTAFSKTVNIFTLEDEDLSLPR